MAAGAGTRVGQLVLRPVRPANAKITGRRRIVNVWIVDLIDYDRIGCRVVDVEIWWDRASEEDGRSLYTSEQKRRLRTC